MKAIGFIITLGVLFLFAPIIIPIIGVLFWLGVFVALACAAFVLIVTLIEGPGGQMDTSIREDQQKNIDSQARLADVNRRYAIMHEKDRLAREAANTQPAVARPIQAVVPAGWYPDPYAPQTAERFWDGEKWAGNTRAIIYGKAEG